MEKSARTESYKHLGEECGVFGMYDFDGGDVAESIYYGLVSLQHRGQESCGIATNDDASIECVKGMGLVSDVQAATRSRISKVISQSDM